MRLDPRELTTKERYKLLIGAIVPRPIAWVSTIDAGGNLNLAPFSYFTAVCSEPMTLLFCPGWSAAREQMKDTLLNIREVPEFVVNITNEETKQAMNRTATELPRGVNEFEWAGVTPVAAETVQVPRVKEAPVAFECTLQQIVVVGEGPGGGAAVFGEVQAVHIRDELYADGYILPQRLQPIGRMAGAGYAHIRDFFEMERIPPPAD